MSRRDESAALTLGFTGLCKFEGRVRAVTTVVADAEGVRW